MLVGKYTHQLDAKNRFFVPAKYREILGDKLVIVKNVDRCLSLYSMASWEKFCAKFEEQPQIKLRKMLRQIYSNAWTVEPDGQGRVAIPDDLKQYANLEKTIMILGCGDYAEIWSEEAYMVEESMEDEEELLRMMLEAGL